MQPPKKSHFISSGAGAFRASALALGLVLTAPLIAQTAPAASAEGPTVELEAFTVTGSNLRAGQSTGGANLRVATAVEVEQSGAPSVASFLKKLPEMGAEGFGENRVNTSSPGTAAVSLRGLGANATLVLLNGRRVAPAPFAQGGSAAALGTTQFVDLNLIPVDAIARVEVLKDGASAIYGADAVAGVVNLVLKDNVSGTAVRGSYGDFTGGIAASTTKFSAYTGATSGALKVFALANTMRQGNIRYGELAPKLVALGNGNNPGTFVVPVGAINPITGGVIPADAAAAARTFTVDPTAPSGFNTTPATANQNRYNINAELTPQPRVTRAGMLATASYEFSRDFEAYAEFNYQQNTNLEYLSASPITNLNTVTLPANAAFNPFGVAVTNSPAAGATLIYRFTEAGSRATETTSDFYRFVGGLKGAFGETWTWDASVLYNLAKSRNDLVAGWLSQAAVNAALADTNRATALNLFTNGTTVRNNPATIARLKSDGTRDARTEITSANVKATGTVYELTAGAINVATGLEWRDERFRDKRSADQLLNQSTPVGQSKGSRRVQAAYAEVRVPLTDAEQNIPALHALELNLAARYESYSDAGFSETAVPKVGVRWQPFNEQVTFRASSGEGYRAPSLAELYQPQTTSIVFNLADPLRAGRAGSNVNDTNTGQRQLVSGGNPNLKPETSTSYNYGVYVEPKVVPGLSFSADYFRIEMEDRIGPPASAAIILANPSLFPGFVDRAPQTASDVANNLPGELIRIRTVLGNFGTARTEGLDLAVEYRLDTVRYGRFNARASASKVFDTVIRSRPDLPAVDVVGTYEVPDFRGSGSLGWSRGKLGASVTVDYIGDFADTAPSTRKVAKQTITGAQVSYAFPWDTKVTLGASNLFDKAPPLTAGSTGYAERTSYFLPRFVYLDVTKQF